MKNAILLNKVSMAICNSYAISAFIKQRSAPSIRRTATPELQRGAKTNLSRTQVEAPQLLLDAVAVAFPSPFQSFAPPPPMPFIPPTPPKQESELKRIVDNDRKQTQFQCEECGWESEWRPTHRAVELSHECKRKQVKSVFT